MDVPPLLPDTLDRMERAVAKVEERLQRSMAALAAAAVPAAVIGAKAVEHWVGTMDPGAVRNTPNVDLLIDRADDGRARVALEGVGFVRQEASDRPVAYLDEPGFKRRQAVQLWFAGDTLPRGIEPLPGLHAAVSVQPYPVIELSTLIRMKLDAHRTIDRVHLRDMADVGLIDPSWVAKYPPELAARLQHIFDTPGG